MSEGQDTLVERLLTPERATEPYQSLGDLCREAADRIKQQDAEIARLREAIETALNDIDRETMPETARILSAALSQPSSGDKQ